MDLKKSYVKIRMLALGDMPWPCDYPAKPLQASWPLGAPRGVPKSFDLPRPALSCRLRVQVPPASRARHRTHIQASCFRTGLRAMLRENCATPDESLLPLTTTTPMTCMLIASCCAAQWHIRGSREELLGSDVAGLPQALRQLVQQVAEPANDGCNPSISWRQLASTLVNMRPKSASTHLCLPVFGPACCGSHTGACRQNGAATRRHDMADNDASATYCDASVGGQRQWEATSRNPRAGHDVGRGLMTPPLRSPGRMNLRAHEGARQR